MSSRCALGMALEGKQKATCSQGKESSERQGDAMMPHLSLTLTSHPIDGDQCFGGPEPAQQAHVGSTRQDEQPQDCPRSQFDETRHAM